MYIKILEYNIRQSKKGLIIQNVNLLKSMFIYTPSALAEFKTTPLDRNGEVQGTDLFLQHSPYVLDRVQVRTLGNPIQNLHSSPIYTFLCHF